MWPRDARHADRRHAQRLVTDLDLDVRAVSKLYRERGDCETRLRRDEEPVGLGRVRHAGPQAHGHRRGPERLRRQPLEHVLQARGRLLVYYAFRKYQLVHRMYPRHWGLSPRFLCGRTSPASSQAEKEAILPDSYRCSPDGKSRSQTADGSAPESSPQPPDATGWRGECLTLSIPEFPNFRGRSRSEGAVSSLSDILVRGNIPRRFYLTVKCAAGLMRRAAKRGKDLPRILKDALLALIRSGCGRESPEAAREPSSARN